MKNFKMTLPTDIASILKTLRKYGNGLVVGGAIRDTIMGREPKDWDFATDVDYDMLLRIFHDFSPKMVGKAFGVMIIVMNDVSYEIARFREDFYTNDDNEKRVEFVGSFKEDASRRDFTINAMGYSEEDGLVDYFNGVEDIRNKVVRFIGDGEQRIKEDNSRMMRAIRFASTLGFELSEDSKLAIENKCGNIVSVPSDRIILELEKILVDDKPSCGINLMHDTGLLQYVIPELDECYGYSQNNKYHNLNLFDHVMGVLDNSNPDIVSRLAGLLHDIGKIPCMSVGEDGYSHYYGHAKKSANLAKVILRRLRVKNSTIDSVTRIIYDHMNKSEKLSVKAKTRFINRVGAENMEAMFSLLRADILAHDKPHSFDAVDTLEKEVRVMIDSNFPLTRADLSVDGLDFVEIGIIGKDIAVALKTALEIAIEDPTLNTKEVLISKTLERLGGDC